MGDIYTADEKFLDWLDVENAKVRKHISYIEDVRKQPPTDRQVKAVKRILKDFGWKKVQIPDFDTYAQLDRWKDTYIRTHLGEEG